jgi:hypothetical protein
MDLEELASQLRSVFGRSISVERSGETLLIGVAGRDSQVGVTIADPDRPSFDVTYPAVRGEESGLRDARDHSAAGVLFVALTWIVREIVEYGAGGPSGDPSPTREVRPTYLMRGSAAQPAVEVGRAPRSLRSLVRLLNAITLDGQGAWRSRNSSH